jgi:hypothetical protein
MAGSGGLAVLQKWHYQQIWQLAAEWQSGRGLSVLQQWQYQQHGS